MRHSFGLAFGGTISALAIALAACGGDSTTTPTGTGDSSADAGNGSTSNTSTSSTSTGVGGASTSTTTSTSSTGTGGSASTSTSSSGGGGGGAPTCQEGCISDNPAAAEKFEGYELKECGCPKAAPCAGMCTDECADPMKLMMGTPCATCLLAEAGKGMSSQCTLKAGLTDCLPDKVCSPFVQCITGCP